jgi:ATP-binding cassette subfamily B protein
MMGRTTLVIAHRLSTVRALDRLLVLDKGKVIEEGSHDALIRLDRGLYRRLFERQALELIKGLGESESLPETTGAKTAARTKRIDDASLVVEK